MITCTIFWDSNKENCNITCAKYKDPNQPAFKKMEFRFVFGPFRISFTNYIDPQLTARMCQPWCVSHCFDQSHKRQGGTFVGEVNGVLSARLNLSPMYIILKALSKNL